MATSTDPKASSNYGQGHSSAVVRDHGSRNAANTCTYFTHLLKPDFSLLDVGCGPGSITSSLARLIPQGRAIGVDYADTAMEAARTQPDLPENCSFQIGLAGSLPFEDASFDVVHDNNVLCHLKDPVGAMKEMHRVCKPGGFVACGEGDTGSAIVHPPIQGVLDGIRVNRKNIELCGGTPNGGRHLIQWAIAAGFDAAKIDYSAGTQCAGGKDAAWYCRNMADRVSGDQSYRSSVLKNGIATETDLDFIRDGHLALAEEPTAVFALIHGRVVCWK